MHTRSRLLAQPLARRAATAVGGGGSCPRPAAAASAVASAATATRSRLRRPHAQTIVGSHVPRASLSTDAPPLTTLTTADIRNMKGFVIDMDGVLYHSNQVIPGALDFIAWLKRSQKRFLFLTNSSERSPRELQEKLRRLGIEVGAEHFYTSALATAAFLSRQKPNGSAYVIGEPGLMAALYDAGYSMNDTNPDYVVVGETSNYNYAMMEKAVALVRRGARLIGTNVDITDRSQDSFVPACGSLTKPIEMASGRDAYFIGKPNPLIMRAALNKLQVRGSEACIIGDRLDTDILAGIQSEIRTVLVLSGVTALQDVSLCAYRPDCILPSVGHVLQDGVEVREPTAEEQLAMAIANRQTFQVEKPQQDTAKRQLQEEE